jgi:hypothetical protein
VDAEVGRIRSTCRRPTSALTSARLAPLVQGGPGAASRLGPLSPTEPREPFARWQAAVARLAPSVTRSGRTTPRPPSPAWRLGVAVDRRIAFRRHVSAGSTTRRPVAHRNPHPLRFAASDMRSKEAQTGPTMNLKRTRDLLPVS